MTNEKSFPKGIRFYEPREGAPDFVRGSIQVNVDEFIEYLQGFKKEGKLHLKILKSKKSGASYLDIDDYKMKKLQDNGGEVFGTSGVSEQKFSTPKKDNDLPF